MVRRQVVGRHGTRFLSWPPIELKVVDKFGYVITAGVWVINTALLLILGQGQFFFKLVIAVATFLFTVAARYLVYFILWMQLINPFCTRCILYYFTCFFLGFSVVGCIGGLVYLPILFFTGSDTDVTMECLMSLPICVSFMAGSIRTVL